MHACSPSRERMMAHTHARDRSALRSTGMRCTARRHSRASCALSCRAALLPALRCTAGRLQDRSIEPTLMLTRRTSCDACVPTHTRASHGVLGVRRTGCAKCCTATNAVLTHSLPPVIASRPPSARAVLHRIDNLCDHLCMAQCGYCSFGTRVMVIGKALVSSW